jgi:hypothetical protein
MKATFYVNETLKFEIEDSAQTGLFEQLAEISEVFSNDTCGHCGGKATFRVREVDENKYFEMWCPSCYAKLAFGQNKKGNTLFPKRKDKEGKYLDKNGWVKYVKPSAIPAATPAAATPADSF